MVNDIDSHLRHLPPAARQMFERETINAQAAEIRGNERVRVLSSSLSLAESQMRHLMECASRQQGRDEAVIAQLKQYEDSRHREMEGLAEANSSIYSILFQKGGS